MTKIAQLKFFRTYMGMTYKMTEGYRNMHWCKKVFIKVVDHPPEAGRCQRCGHTRFYVRRGPELPVGHYLRCHRCWAKHRVRLELDE